MIHSGREGVRAGPEGEQRGVAPTFTEADACSRGRRALNAPGITRPAPHSPFLLPMGRLVLSSEAKELCLESWALAARALFHRALISMEARYSVWRRGRRSQVRESTPTHTHTYPPKRAHTPIWIPPLQGASKRDYGSRRDAGRLSTAYNCSFVNFSSRNWGPKQLLF